MDVDAPHASACDVTEAEERITAEIYELVLGKFGLVWSQAIFAGPETQRSRP